MHSKEESAKRPEKKTTVKRTCKICRARFDREKVKTWVVWCSPDCGYEYSKELRAKQKREAWKKEKEKIKQYLGIKPKKQSQDSLQKAVNKIARLIDKGQRCLARPNEAQNTPLEGGHIYSVGSYPSLRYHLWNIHGQSHKSNAILGGEPDLMLQGIERRYGIEKRNDVEDLRKRYPVLKLTKAEKKEAVTKANRIIKELESGKVYTRDEVNDILGIYKNEK